MQTTGDVCMNKDPFTSKYMVVDKVGTSNFSNTVWGGNGLLSLFPIPGESSYIHHKKKKTPFPFTGHKTGHISEKVG